MYGAQKNRMRFLYLEAVAYDLFEIAHHDLGKFIGLFFAELDKKCAKIPKDKKMEMLATSLLEPKLADLFLKKNLDYVSQLVHCWFTQYFYEVLEFHEFEIRDREDLRQRGKVEEIFNSPPNERIGYIEPLLRKTARMFEKLSRVAKRKEVSSYNVSVWLLYELRCFERDERAEQPYDVMAARKMAELELAHKPV